MTRVAVIAGGLSPERDVSIRSGRRVAEDLRAAGLDVDVLDVDANLLPRLAQEKPDCAFPLVHGIAGEDGSLPEILATVGIPFVGSPSASCRLAFDKVVAGAQLTTAGIHVPASVCLPQAMFRDLGAPALLTAIVDRVGLPLVVKPNRGGSALGVSVVTEPSELSAAMIGAFAYGDVVLVQRHIAGTEIAVTILETGAEPEALPAVEIVPDGGLYDYTARYTAGMTEFFAPARLSNSVAQSAAATAITAHTSLQLRDWSRSDLIVDDDGVVWFLEVNVSPGMTETSLVPQSIQASGRRVPDVMATLVQRALDRG